MDEHSTPLDSQENSRPEAVSEDGRWMTKAELARVRGINLASADRLIRRKDWRRTLGNDGRARVLVPLSWLDSLLGRPQDAPIPDPTDEKSDATENPTDASPGNDLNPTDMESVPRIISELRDVVASSTEDALRALRERAEAVDAFMAGMADVAKAAQAQTELAMTLARHATEQADQQRERAVRAEQALEAMRADLKTVQDAAAALRRANNIRQSAPLLGRLLGAWRGQ